MATNFQELSGQIQPVYVVNDVGEGALTASATIDTDFTGIRAVAVAGTPLPGPNVESPTGFFLKGHPDNTDTVWYFPRGRTKANGYPLNAKDQIFANVKNLSVLSFDADVSGEKICWSKA